MDVKKELKYPVGIQTFPEIINNGLLYIDKTQYIWRITRADMKYIFLSRPRRFGKSLLTSTLHSYFAGEKELFRGLAIDALEKEWKSYPVLHFDMSLGKHLQPDMLQRYLIDMMRPYEEKYGIASDAPDVNLRLNNLIRGIFKKTGQLVVVLIDEYDAPLLDVVHKGEVLESLRFIMRNFFSPLKGNDPYLRYVFLTGITKFAQMSIFSELNNLNNISMDHDFAAICGISEDELLSDLRPGIEQLAEANNMGMEECLAKLKKEYDGYHFCWPSQDIYNPYSLMKALAKKRIDDYWFESGTPTFMVELLKKYNVPASHLAEDQEADIQQFNIPPDAVFSPTPLLYQSGYYTIKGYDSYTESYLLGVPNQEVYRCFFSHPTD